MAAERAVRALRRRLACAAILGALLSASVVLSGTASASTGYVGNRILNAAETRVNDSYVYGSAGPSYFDCSGLVYWAATAAGERDWPRDTYDIARLIGTRFTLTTRPQRGDLALWGSISAPYHVAIVTVWHGIYFETQQPGWAGRVTWHDDHWFRPSFFLHVNW